MVCVLGARLITSGLIIIMRTFSASPCCQPCWLYENIPLITLTRILPQDGQCLSKEGLQTAGGNTYTVPHKVTLCSSPLPLIFMASSILLRFTNPLTLIFRACTFQLGLTLADHIVQVVEIAELINTFTSQKTQIHCLWSQLYLVYIMRVFFITFNRLLKTGDIFLRWKRSGAKTFITRRRWKQRCQVWENKINKFIFFWQQSVFKDLFVIELFSTTIKN